MQNNEQDPAEFVDLKDLKAKKEEEKERIATIYREVERFNTKSLKAMLSNLRNGNFTSSEIVALTKWDRSGKKPGVPFYTYIEECNMERRLGRALCSEITAKPTSWGIHVEPRVHNLLSTKYKLCSTETVAHPSIDCWFGSPDVVKWQEIKTVGDIKCPITLKSFCQLIDSFKKGGIEQVREDHPDGEKYYYQLVSNAILTGAEHAELIVYCPYKSELDEIRKLADGNPKLYWIQFSEDEELPYLIDGGNYKNLNILDFEVSFLDKQFLTERVLMGKDLLVPYQNLIAA